MKTKRSFIAIPEIELKPIRILAGRESAKKKKTISPGVYARMILAKHVSKCKI
jgi:hypothetical protein